MTGVTDRVLLDEALRRARNYLESIDRRPVGPGPEALAGLGRLAGPLPEDGSPPLDVLALLDEAGSMVKMVEEGENFYVTEDAITEVISELTGIPMGKLDTGAADTGWGIQVPTFDPATNTLMGRPIIATQACETLGDKGDITLAHLPSYLSLTKTSGVRSQMSIHLCPIKFSRHTR